MSEVKLLNQVKFHYLLEYSEEVRKALTNKKPLVALETSIISQGLPYPYNYETALSLEERIREQGVVPVTIGILHGKIKIGLTPDELKVFATDKNIHKVNAQNIPITLSKKKTGATTVAGTLACAKLAAIEILATGGIGGIHRDFDRTHDMSSDLQQIANTKAIVVCSGVKAILDIPKTLEILETLGVMVGTFRSDKFPAFWSRTSGMETPLRLSSVDEIASIFSISKEVQHTQGFIVANPVPSSHEIPQSTVEPMIKESLAEARKRKVKGKTLTPYLLDSIYRLSAGRSMQANIELVKNNATLAAQIALKLGRK